MSPASALDLLDPDGPLAALLPGYEPRASQLLMAAAVEKAFRQERRLLCEAGTGTGKTLAYLAPALLSGKKVLISTATKALQEQIFTKDLPLLARAGLPVDASLIKGMSNYLCLRRYHQLRGSAAAGDETTAPALAAVTRWLESTEAGDLSELEGTPGDAVRAEIAASSEARVGPGCVHFDECFITRNRQRAESARLLIVNHHLFLADLALRGPSFGGGVLPDYDAVVLDEAHQIEDIATEFFGVRVSDGRLSVLVRDAERSLEAAGLTQGRRKLTQAQLPRAAEVRRLLDNVRVASEHFFSAVAALLGIAGGRAPVDPQRWTRDHIATYHRLDAALESLGLLAAEAQLEPLQGIARRCTALRNDLALVVEGARHRVLWGDVQPRSIALVASPIDVAPLLRARLFEPVGAVILTSATLATNGGFDYVRQRLGLTPDLGPIDELSLPSPFDYTRQALLYIASSLPDPQDPAHLEQAVEHALSLIALSAGGAFVLCTSVRSMRAFHERLARAGVAPLFLQGEAPKTTLLERFRTSGHAVLVATMSFWEGVDVPGDALRLVILDKIPFPVPTDPLVAARGASIEEEGGSRFLDYHLPAAAITLKQGFGRLVRSITDRGVVAVLDRRLVGRTYGARLLEALPPARVTEWIEDVAAFFEGEPPDDAPPSQDSGPALGAPPTEGGRS